MNTELLDSIYNAITIAVSGDTKHIYFDWLPDEKLLKQLTVVFELKNTSNDNNFDQKEVIKFYGLDIKINAPDLKKLENKSIYIKNQLYRLSTVSYINLIEEDLFWDSELNVWTSFSKFEIQA